MLTPSEGGPEMENSKPWWEDDPELAAIRRRVEEQIESWDRRPIMSDEPDPRCA
jgi:hypothetical protein